MNKLFFEKIILVANIIDFQTTDTKESSNQNTSMVPFIQCRPYNMLFCSDINTKHINSNA
ncbi:hypothetical protein K5549_002297 [Capra hircus]|uniref:Uncharacterized protein n=1 Tax=Capra hircus TaxID=9925 RepID=A0A452FNY4_CAPHI|nr:hypothetical protein K5549_002297 [Capra hircus]